MKSQLQDPKPLDSVEETLKDVYIEEYHERFPNILEENQIEFFDNLRRRVVCSLEEKYPNIPEEAISKVEAQIKTDYYNPHFQKASEMYQMNIVPKYGNCDFINGNIETYSRRKSSVSKSCNSDGPVYFRQNFIKHCKLTEEPIHACGEKLIQTWNSCNDDHSSFFLLCMKCKKVYQPNCIQLFCSPCNMEYYSSWTGDSNESENQPATWAKYHCNIIYNEKMKCIKCRELFFLSQKTGLLTCLKCKLSVNPLAIQWTCIMCKEEFKSEAKVYNPNEFKSVKLAVKNALFEKIKATPNAFQCCKEIVVDSTIFVHKKECTGELFLGKLHGKQIVVCSKCRSMNLYEKYIWSCPFCYKRFKTCDKSKQNIAGDPSQSHKNSSTKSPSPTHRLSVQTPGIPSAALQLQDSVTKSPKSKHNASHTDVKAFINMSPPNSTKKANGRLRRISLCGDISLESPFSRKMEDAPIKKNLIEDFQNLPLIEEEESEDCKKSILTKAKNMIPLSKEFSKGNIKRMNSTPYEQLHKPLSPLKNQKKAGGYPPICQIKNRVMQKMNSELNLSVYNDEKKKDTSSKSSSQEVSLNSKETYETDTSKESIIKPAVKSSLASFNIEDYKIINQVGEGSFGKIYQVESNYYVQQSSASSWKVSKKSLSKESFAMKKIIAHSQKDINEIIREYELIDSIATRNKSSTIKLISIYGIQTKMLDQTTYAIYILMDLASTDWEKEIIVRNKVKSYYSEKELIGILKDMVFSLAELQRAKIAHRDIKPQNILVFPNNVYKLADFGEAKQLLSYKNSCQTIRGTELYMSPILFHTVKNKKTQTPQNQIEHNAFKSDVFSLGLCFLLAGSLTFNSLYDIRQLKDMALITGIVNRYLKLRYSSQLIGIIQKMLQVNEKERCDFLELEKIILFGL